MIESIQYQETIVLSKGHQVHRPGADIATDFQRSLLANYARKKSYVKHEHLLFICPLCVSLGLSTFHMSLQIHPIHSSSISPYGSQLMWGSGYIMLPGLVKYSEDIWPDTDFFIRCKLSWNFYSLANGHKTQACPSWAKLTHQHSEAFLVIHPALLV